MRYSKFVHYVQNYRQTLRRCSKKNQNAPRPSEHPPVRLLLAGCQNSTALNSLHCSIISRVEVNCVDVCGFDTRRGSPELQQVRLLVRFPLRRLRFSLRTHTSVLLYSNTIRYPGDTGNLFRLVRTDTSRQNSPTTNARSVPYRYTGVCCTKRFAELNGNCESYCSLEQLVASLSAADVGKSAAGTYQPKIEGYTRRHLHRPPGLLYCGVHLD